MGEDLTPKSHNYQTLKTIYVRSQESAVSPQSPYKFIQSLPRILSYSI